jgi:hypothetical protein
MTKTKAEEVRYVTELLRRTGFPADMIEPFVEYSMAQPRARRTQREPLAKRLRALGLSDERRPPNHSLRHEPYKV